ncbi:MAG: VIT1/CCC1 transporter family protein [Candidatus Parvarchaeota archaeon]|nr:VIT1/CCC1 transporter family protein [Candidatus Parvarchaeota archaeon]MCW1301875.1 VIT1/CCC1 transporter family protein [Candidatus Parvarchaeota archaeon]
MPKEIEKILASEELSYNIYSRLGETERNMTLKRKLNRLKELDKKHIRVWKEIYSELNIPIKESKNKFTIFLLILLRRLFGIGLTLSAINSLENRKLSDLSKVFNKIPDKRKEEIINYLVEEIYQERLIKRDPWESKVLSHIRDIIFGMNDGLVEVLAAVAGLTGAIHNNLLIAIAGTIVGVSGTTSMAVGAYLSSRSEKDINIAEINRLELELQVAKERLKEDLKYRLNNYKKFSKDIDSLISKLRSKRDPIYRVLEREKNNPLMSFIGGEAKMYDRKDTERPFKDAVYVGVFYILGAIIPLISFLIGSVVNSNVYYNLIISVVLTSIAIAVTSFIIALNSNENPPKYILRALLLSLMAAFATFLIGHIASVYFNIVI